MELIKCHPEDPVFKSLKRDFYEKRGLPQAPEPTGPHLHSCFVVLNNDRPLARAALFKNPLQGGGNKRYAQVGSFEAENHYAASRLLFERLGREARNIGSQFLIGPMNGSTWHNYRFNEEAVEPFFTETCHPDYYPALWESAGFKKEARYYSARSENIQENELKAPQPQSSISIRKLEIEHYEEELKKIHRFCLKAFADNLFFTPIEQRDFLSLYRPLKKYLDPSLILLAEAGRNLVGMVLGLPNHLDASGKSVIIKTLARLPEKQFQGLGNYLAHQAYFSAQSMGFQSIIHAYMLHDGQSTSVSNSLHGEAFRYYSLYSKTI